MKLILEKDCVKREIEGPFAICISGDDAKRLVSQLQEALDKDAGLFYGWITIYDAPSVRSRPDSKPLPWV